MAGGEGDGCFWFPPEELSEYRPTHQRKYAAGKYLVLDDKRGTIVRSTGVVVDRTRGGHLVIEFPGRDELGEAAIDSISHTAYWQGRAARRYLKEGEAAAITRRTLAVKSGSVAPR